ncbi:hypothetical protein PVL29_012571 [Vitis rotundifolia]|uniref:HMA domain-containing protein n=1 Tax=Vitis rotundifolia TaxID=103349 RepID=A0AA38ZKK4_VITRO|nr:hypothetical protein PVL29_012571 [Vitis rotundifolia]
MKLKVNLGCKRCYKKIKKLLCKFPEIRDQTFIEKENTVIITVVCCSPCKIRDKLICKGGKTIESIECIEPETQKPTEDKKKENGQRKKNPGPQVSTPVPGYPPFIYLTGVCCKSCYGGCGGCPCHHGYGIPHQPSSYGWASGCRCDRSYGCRCEFVIEENPTCTIL